MSSIEAMTVQGIRSFGPDDKDKQLIQFNPPLTLILGPNGTGKTTIIECLKYMTTGELPPGGKMGAAFIHDPKVAGEVEVKAQVRLKFQDVRGQQCLAVRSLTATQKKTRVEFKNLEGVIKRYLPSGECRTTSSKCTETDREMVSLLGVSKAVLENVIFCHQEDSNWPLGEGKALKEKFDDIFASTRYVKALEQIRKFRNEQSQTIREYQAEIKYLKQNKDKAAEINSNLTDREERFEAAKNSVNQITEKLEPVLTKLRLIQDKEEEIRQVCMIIEKLKSERGQMERGQRELKKNIKKEFEGSTEELKRELAEFETKVDQMDRTVLQNQKRLADLESRLEKLNQDRHKLLTEQGRLEQDAERHSNDIKTRDHRVSRLAEEYKLPGFSGSITDAHSARLSKNLDDIGNRILEQARTERAKCEDQEDAMQKDIDRCRSNKTKLETEQSLKQDRVRKNRDEIRRINGELSQVDASAGQLKDIDRKIRALEMNLGEAEKSVDLDKLKSELQSLQGESSASTKQIRALDSELSRLNQESSVRTEVEVLLKDKTVKEEQVRRLKVKNEDTLKHLIGSLPSEFYGKAVEKYQREHSRRLRDNTEQLQQMKRDATKLETVRKHEQDLLQKKSEEVRDHEQKINAVTHGSDFGDGLESIEKKLQKCQDDKGQLVAIKYMFGKYIEKLRGANADCPLCHRPFDEQSEVEDLISEMETKLNLVPEKLDRLEQTIVESKSEFENWLQLKPFLEVKRKCKDSEIPEIEKRIQSLNLQIKKLNDDITEKEDSVEVESHDEQLAKSLMPDATQMDRLQAELQDLLRKIGSLSEKLTSENTRSFKEVQAEREELQLQLDHTNQMLDHKRQKANDHSAQLQELKAQLNELRSTKLRIETNLQQRVRLEQTKDEMEKTNDALESEIRDAREKSIPIQEEIDDLCQKKEQVTKLKDRQYDEKKEQFNKVQENAKQLVHIQAEIDRYVKNGCAENLSSCQKKMSEIQSEASDLTQKKLTLSSSINKVHQELSEQKVQKRELSDNLLLRKGNEDITLKESQIKKEEEKLGGLNANNLTVERNRLQKDYEKFNNEKDLAKRRQQVLEGEIFAFRKDLKDDMYKDAEVKYKDKLIQLKTTELANGDLDKYYKALDATIMAYHSQKMADINKTIRELWRNTYKGNDIERIEIRSDEDDGSGAAKLRRSYRYRVVMVKGGTELDMRGRCSAGQKVLASLIIRIALAETFCLNCGVLALDEPTTNLDRENIESLAYALVEIIKSRHKQRNFQLVVITHDEDFVELLGRSDYVDNFFRVSKNEFGCSRLTQTSVQDLHSK